MEDIVIGVDVDHVTDTCCMIYEQKCRFVISVHKLYLVSHPACASILHLRNRYNRLGEFSIRSYLNFIHKTSTLLQSSKLRELLVCLASANSLQSELATILLG